MSLTDEIFVLLGKQVTRDVRGLDARLHFFGSVPVDDGTPFPSSGPSANQPPQQEDVAVARPTVVALVSANGGVGRSTLVTALSSGMQRLGESVVALDLDPQNALRHHFGVSASVPGIGRTSLLNTPWVQIQQPGFAGCQVIPFGDIDAQQQENLHGWLKREPDWLAQQLSGLRLSERQTVIIDTPAGNNVYFHQALSVADVVLVIAKADAASLGTLDQLDRLLAPYLAREGPPQIRYVLNQLDEDDAFTLDMLEAFNLRLGGTQPLEVHRDRAISEALAFGIDPLDSQALTLAGDDIDELCRLLIARKKSL